MGWSAGSRSNDTATIWSEIDGMMLRTASNAGTTVAVIAAVPGQVRSPDDLPRSEAPMVMLTFNWAVVFDADRLVGCVRRPTDP